MAKTAKKARAPLPTSPNVTAKNVSAVAAKAAPAPVAASVTVERKALPLTAKIVVVATANPKRPGTKAASKWPLYATAAKLAGGLTVANVVAAFVGAKYPKRRAFSALRWDSVHGFIKIG